MNRRGFLRNLIGGVAATAAVRTFPFRVFSFPDKITPWREGLLEYPECVFPQGWTGRLAAVEALELESFAHEIPDLIRNDSTLWPLLARRTIVGINQSKGIVTMS